MDTEISFGAWVTKRRKALDLTREELAQCVGCSVPGLRKIETDERRPSRQLAELLATCLQVSPDERATFLKAARGELRVERLGAARAAPAATVLWSHPGSNLPSPPTVLIGRESELAALAGLLGDPQCRLLTLVGPGGIGKTRLAIQVASTHCQLFADGVYFVSLAPVSSSEFITSAIANALGLVFPSPTDPRAQLLNYLREKSLLLVLDSVEHLLEAGGLFAEILRQAPGVKLLVTSCERLNLQGEWILEVHGLPFPRDCQAANPETFSALALFLQCARRAKLDFVFRAEDCPFIVRICQLAEGTPLAIELAAAWVRVLACAEIAEEMERDLGLLSTAARDVPERHRSMRAVFDHSWQLLSENEHRALRQLSIFRSGFRREAAQAIASADLPLLSALVDKSLLRRTPAGRYDFHELVRQYAAEHLHQDPAEELEARDRHCRYYLTQLQEREEGLHSCHQKQVVAELTSEIDNIRMAWEWAATRQQVARLQQTAWPLWYYYEHRSLFQEGEAMLLRAVESVKTADVTDALDVTAREVALGYLQIFPACMAFRLGRVAEAQQVLRQCLVTLRRHADPVALATALWVYGTACMFAGQFQEASQCLREAYAVACTAKHQWEITLSAILVGRVEYELGNYLESHRWLCEGLALSRAQGDPSILSYAISSLCRTTHALGRFAEVESVLREGLQTVAETGNRFALGPLQEQLAQVAYARGDVSEAVRLCRETSALYRELGDVWNLTRALTLLGNLTTASDAAHARQCFAEALALALRTDCYAHALDALVGMATLQAESGAIASALELIVHILRNPAVTHETMSRAEYLRAELEPQLTWQQVETIQARAQAMTCDEIVQNLLA